MVCLVAVRGFAFVGKVPPPLGAQKCMSMINPGLAPWAMRECRPYRAISVSDTKPQSISMYQHIRTNECPTTAIQSDNNPSHHRPSANPFEFIHYMGMGEPFRATLLHSPGWRECQRHEQNPGYTHGQKNKSSVGAALSARAFGLFSCGSWLCIRWKSAAPVGDSINVCQYLTQGLRPGLCGSAALAGLIYILPPINYLLIGVLLPSRSLIKCFIILMCLLYVRPFSEN